MLGEKAKVSTGLILLLFFILWLVRVLSGSVLDAEYRRAWYVSVANMSLSEWTYYTYSDIDKDVRNEGKQFNLKMLKFKILFSNKILIQGSESLFYNLKVI